MNKKYFTERKKELEKEIKELETKIRKMPKYNFISYRSNKKAAKYTAWYKISEKDENKKRIYIPKKDFKQARTLAQKTYLHRMLRDRKNELTSIERYLKCRNDETYSRMLYPDSPYRELLVNEYDWENEEYEKSTDFPEALVVQAPKGEFVRSKAEAMIAQILFENNIPYRYENINIVDGKHFASDFTILHPVTGKIYIWEHFGLADDPDYIHNSIMYKLPRYLSDGYLPGYNFIMTFESKKHPLSYDEIYENVKKYFL